MDAYIKAVAYYLPQTVVTNEDLAHQFPEWTAEKIYAKVGIRTRHRAAENETALDMAVQAAENLFKENESWRNSIDYVLFCTQSPDYKLPTSACIIQDRLGLHTECGALDFNLGCSGYVYGLSLAKGLISAQMATSVLLLTGETYSKYIHAADKGNLSIFGDAATATIVSTDGLYKICDFAFGTDGSGAEELIVKTGGARIPWMTPCDGADGIDQSQNCLFMDGASVFSFTLKRVPQLIQTVLEKNGLRMQDIDSFVFHQANVYILEHLRTKLKIDKSKFAYCIENVGNTVSSSIPLVLTENINSGAFLEVRHILLAGFGVGLSWGACVLEAV